MTTNSSTPCDFLYRGFDLIGSSFVSYAGPNLGIMMNSASDANGNFVSLSLVSDIDEHTGQLTDFNDNRATLGPTADGTVNFSDLGPAIAAAEAKGFTVMLKPIAQGPNSQPWLGLTTTVIDNPAAFFASYKAYILKYAALAEQYHVPILSIGNEIAATTISAYTPYWNDLISAVRQVYSGKLTYAALLIGEATHIQFWDKLDFATLDFTALLVRQPTASTPPDPSLAVLNAGWNEIAGFEPGYNNISLKQFVAEIAARSGKDILMQLGFPAIATAANGQGDLLRGDPTIAADYAAQTNLWESFFETWGGANKPSWLLGENVQVYDPLIVNAHTGDGQHDFWSKDDTIYGKPANTVVTSWYGGTNYLSAAQSAIAGSISNDSIALYGDDIANAIQTAGHAPAGQAATFRTAISITLTGTVMNGQTQTIHVYANGIDLGAQSLVTTPTGSVPGGSVDGMGVHYSLQTYNFYADGLVDIGELKIAFDGPVDVGGPESSRTSIRGLSINDTPLTQLTYHPLSGPAQQQTYNGIQDDGGYVIADATPWNTALSHRQIGTIALPIQVSGGGGTDTVDVLGTPSQYAIGGIGTGTITLSESSGLGQNAVLNGVTYLSFLDGAVLDLSSGNYVSFLDGSILDHATGLWSASATSSDIAASLDEYQLLASAGKLAEIHLLDTGAPTLAISAAQSVNDVQALAKVVDAHNLFISVGSGSHAVHGGDGIDTAAFAGNRSSYTVAETASGYTVADSTGGTDTLVNVERLQFADAKVAIDIEGNGGMAYRLYQAAFDRVPDLSGLGYQMNALDTGLYLVQVAANFIASPEFSATYGSLDDTHFVTQLYANVLHRAPDAGGLAYHVDHLAHGFTRADILVGFSESPENKANVIGVIQEGMVYEF